jgi:hypothetical protein
VKRTIIIRGPEDEEGAPSQAEKVSRLRCLLTFGCAGLADGLQWLFPPLWIVYDGAMVIALLVIWGWRWEIAVAVVPEVIPGFDLFPTWTLFAAYLVVARREKPKPQ